ncbi:MAG TPA: SRPBCC family protein [Gemmatirosa sp.]|nr:SRPBCC family protein [Gemmatirosa sp.]
MDRLTISKSIALPAPPARVFAALTTPDEIVAYFPFRRVESAGQVGGTITFHGELDGRPFTDHGEITAWVPEREFAYTYWSDNHGTPRTPEHYLTIRYVLTPDATGGTQLRVEHQRVPAGAYAETMERVWDGLLGLLAAHLAPGAPVDAHPPLGG